MRPLFSLSALLFVGGTASSANAFPDLIRHNYVNCTACHVAPTGGGALTNYGRALSADLLSATGDDREAQPLHGLLNAAMGDEGEKALMEKLIVGGDVRGIQVHGESPTRRSERWFTMQAALELGVRLGRTLGVISIGQENVRANEWRANSSKYYVQWNALDEFDLRAGRFTPVFGINTPYHTLPTRQNMGFAPGQERDTAEAVWSGELWNLAAASSRTPSGPVAADQRETLMTAQVNRTFANSYRVGVSYLKGYTNLSDREAVAVHGLLGFNDHWAYLTEFDLQKTMPHAGDSSTALYHFSQLIYEFAKGWNVYLLEDYAKENLNDSSTLTNSIGPGLRYFPRPHFELDAVFTKKRTASIADRYDDSAWVLVHYYF